MDVKRLPWVSGFLSDLGLEDLGGGFWCSPSGDRSLYLGAGSIVVYTVLREEEYRTQHLYPADPDPGWLLSVIADHAEQAVMYWVGCDDQTLN